MSQDRTTNEQIADLLLAQTYAERMAMAQFFSDQITLSEEPMAAEDVASLFETWAEIIVEAEVENDD